MTEFLDVIRQTKRICKSVNGNCGKCMLSAFSCPNIARFDSTNEQEFIDFANAVTAWPQNIRSLFIQRGLNG